MIRKLARMDAPVEVVRDIFRDTEAWPQWMPGVAATQTLSRTLDSRLVEVIYLVHGRRFVQQLECRETSAGLRHRQIKGWFKTWNAEWTFRTAPQGHGTTVSMGLELELGMAAGLFLPKKVLRHWMSSLLDDTITQGRQRSTRLAARQREPTQEIDLGRPLLQIFETAEGFEVHFAGRTFLLDALPTPESR